MNIKYIKGMDNFKNESFRVKWLNGRAGNISDLAYMYSLQLNWRWHAHRLLAYGSR